MNSLLSTLRRDLGILGLASAAALSLTVLFSISVIQPLEARNTKLERETAFLTAGNESAEIMRVSTRGGAQLDAFYRFFERRERIDEWLAKLYGIGTAAGLQLRAGTYGLDAPRAGFERYHIQLPVRGSYAQIRAFLEASLAEIPVMSLDQVSFRRKAVNETTVEADIVLTLHLLRR